MPTFRYSSGFTVAPAVGSAAQQHIEHPFADPMPMPRPNGTRHGSGATGETTTDPVFDEPKKKFSLETDLTTDDEASFYRGSPMDLTPNHTFNEAPVLPRSDEPFPPFNPSQGDSLSQKNEESERVQSKAQNLMNKLKGVLRYIKDFDQKFELWTSDLDEKRLRKKRLAEKRRNLIARTKEVNRECKAKIKVHKEKETERNKRATKQLKEQKKEMKEQAKRRDKAAKGECNWFTSLKIHICKRAEHEDPKTPRLPISEPIPVHHTVTHYSGVSCTEREIQDDMSEDYLFIRGAEEYDPTQYRWQMGI
jgi:hypothetical protein